MAGSGDTRRVVIVCAVAVGAVAGALLGAGVARIVGLRDAASLSEHRLRAERAREAAEAAVMSASADGARLRDEAMRARAATARVAGAAALLRTAEARSRAGEVGLARTAFVAAAGALREAILAAGDSQVDALREELARALVGLGEVELAADDAEQARAAFAEAAGLPPPSATSRARAAVGLEAALRALGRAAPAGALAACRTAVAADPHDAEASLALTRALVSAGDVAHDRGERSVALSAFTEAADRGRTLEGRLALEVLAGALERLATVAPAGPSGARALEEALRARRSIALQSPNDVRAGRALVRTLVACAARAGDVTHGSGAIDALALLDEAVAGAKQGVARRADSTEDRELLVLALEADGVARLEAGDRVRARQSLEQALPLARAHPGARTGAPARTIVRLSLALARTLVRERDLVGARAALEEASTRARALLEQDPGDAAVAGDLVLTLVHQSSLEQGPLARARLRDAYVVAEAQHLAAPDDVGMRRALALVQWRLGALEQAHELTRGRPGAELDGLETALEQARARRQLLQGPPGSPPEALKQAYALLSLGDHGGAVTRFEVAFSDAALRSDTAQSHLYNAARAAAQAGAKGRALEWLGEDVKRRRERAASLAVSEKDERERLLRSVEHARRAEPAFAGLRGTAEFEALFQ